MAMLTAELCPKCGGSILFEEDYYGFYKQCLQCGYLKDIEIKFEEPDDTLTLSEESHGESERQYKQDSTHLNKRHKLKVY